MLLQQRNAMARFCTNCGEELLGAVNRCWKCGDEVLTRGGFATPTGPNIPLAEVVPDSPESTDEAWGDDQQAVPPTQEEADQSEAEVVLGDLQDKAIVGDVVPGEPLEVIEAETVAPSVVEPPQPDYAAKDHVAEITRYPLHMAAGGGAVASLILGLIGFGSAFWIPEGGVLIGLLGIAMGAWGLYSQFRGWAAAGLTVCVLSFALSGTLLTIKVHEAMFGYGPFDPPPAEVDATGLPKDRPAPVFK